MPAPLAARLATLRRRLRDPDVPDDVRDLAASLSIMPSGSRTRSSCGRTRLVPGCARLPRRARGETADVHLAPHPHPDALARP